MTPTNSMRWLRVAWVASVLSAPISFLLLARLLPDGVNNWKFILAFALLPASLLVFALSHAILMHRSWRVGAGSGGFHKAKRVLYWLLAPTMVAGVIGFLLTLSSMFFD